MVSNYTSLVAHESEGVGSYLWSCTLYVFLSLSLSLSVGNTVVLLTMVFMGLLAA